MSDSTIPAVLSPAEWRLVQAIRNLPATPLQGRVNEVLGELLFYVQNPRCEGIGAEGFPCGEPVSSCEECHQVWDLLEAITHRLETAKK